MPCTTKYVWFDPWVGAGMVLALCKSLTLGIEVARWISALMIVDGLESLPIVGRVERKAAPSGPYTILRPFHSRSKSQASLALRAFTSCID